MPPQKILPEKEEDEEIDIREIIEEVQSVKGDVA
jgi:hypothetical protein